MQTTKRAPASDAGSPVRGVIARVLSALRGDKYMVGAYPPAAGDPQGAVVQDRDVDADGPGRSAIGERELPLHFAPPISRAEER